MVPPTPKSDPNPQESAPAGARQAGTVYKIASSPEPEPIDSIGWTASQGVTSAYRFADSIRREAGKD